MIKVMRGRYKVRAHSMRVFVAVLHLLQKKGVETDGFSKKRMYVLVGELPPDTEHDLRELGAIVTQDRPMDLEIH